MFIITIPENELFDEQKGEFVTVKSQTLQLEHSLLSLSKWEAKWCKPFLKKESKTVEEILDYVRCMTINQGVDPLTYKCITRDHVNLVQNYIDSPMTATTFSDENTGVSREVITSELIYYWMIASNIPFDPCQKWHLNRLLTLIRVCSIKNSPSKKMSKSEIMARNSALNKARRAAMNSRG